LDLRIFSSGNYVIAVVIMAVVALAMFGTFSLLPLYLQNVAGLNATQSGLVLLPGSVLMGLLGPVMGRIYDAKGPKTLLVPGTILIAAAMFSYSIVSPSTPTWVLVVVRTGVSGGLAASFTPLFSASLGSLDPHLYSHGSAARTPLRQVAGRTGVEAGAPRAQSAFLLAAIIALVAVVLAFLIKKPEDQEDHPAEEVNPVETAPRD